jgi:DNA-binding CsgD family transcriptional regulator
MSNSMKASQEIVFKTSEAAYAVDREGHIVAWNQAAENVFGYTDDEALGKKCWELLHGEDAFGNQYCCEGCPVLNLAFSNKSVNCFHVTFKTASLEMKDFAVSALLLSSDAGVDLMVHLCREESGIDHKPINGSSKHQNGFSKHRIAPPARRGNLTNREIEVLSLLAEGKSTDEVSSALQISGHTVRNHVQNVLGKLQVHSRLKAINLSRRLGLIEYS